MGSRGSRSGTSGVAALVALAVAAAIGIGLTDAGETPTGSRPAPMESPVTPTGSILPTRAASTPPAPSGPAATGSALALLARLAVKGRAPRTGYDRTVFGPAWADTDRNGCDTRNDILRRDLDDVVLRPGTHGCVVLSGDLADPYTREQVAFVRGGASEVDIDHVVALADAWRKGAQQWPAARRVAFANDPLNLLAVSSWVNRQKGAADAATWLPPNRAYRCQFVARQVAVKARYGLWVTAAERAAAATVLHRCPGVPAPTGTAPTLAPVRAR